MLRKSAVIIVIMVLSFSVFGCKKKSAPSPPPPAQQQPKTDVNSPAAESAAVKSRAEFDAQAKKEIDVNNMKAELDRLEKELQQETGGRNIQ